MGLSETAILILVCGFVAVCGMFVWNQIVGSRSTGRMMHALLQHSHRVQMEASASIERTLEKLMLDPEKSAARHAMERTARAQFQTSLERDQIRQEGAPQAPAPPPRSPDVEGETWHPDGRATRNLDAARQ